MIKLSLFRDTLETIQSVLSQFNTIHNRQNDVKSRTFRLNYPYVLFPLNSWTRFPDVEWDISMQNRIILILSQPNQLKFLKFFLPGVLQLFLIFRVLPYVGQKGKSHGDNEYL